MKPLSRSLSSMTAFSSNPSSTRASSSFSVRLVQQLHVPQRHDLTDQQRPSQRRRKNHDNTRSTISAPSRSYPTGITVNKRAACITYRTQQS
jgi:hypothetical protein